jgi:hypothetical protein
MEKRMSKVRFLQDFQGRETLNAFYSKGAEVDLPEHIAERMVQDGRAEYVQVEKVENVGSIYDVEPQFEQPAPPEPKKRGRK